MKSSWFSHIRYILYQPWPYRLSIYPVPWVPRLPRMRRACHVKPRSSATPATQSAAASRATKRAQARHPVPWVPRLHANDRKVPRRHARPSGPKRATQCHECHACHAKQPWMWDCATPATWNQGGCSPGARLPRKVPRRHARPSGPKRATQCHECHACHAKRRWMWDCATPGVWQSCVERWCVTKLCVNVGVWQVVWKLVCDKVVCDKVVLKVGVWQSCVWQSCVSKVCDKVVCERWCVQHGWWQMMCDKVVCVWSYCMWKMVCDKVVCRRCVTKLCVKDGVQSCMWQRWYVAELEEAGGGGGGTGATRIQNQKQNPTQSCGE